MRWSKLKEQVEHAVTPKLAGRVRLMATRYRRAHDAEGRWALVLDGVEVGGIGCLRADREESELTHQLTKQDVPMTDAHRLVSTMLTERAHHPVWLFYRAIQSYLKMPIQEALSSRDALVRSLAYLDRRTGRRRLAELAKTRPATDIETASLTLRLHVENLSPAWSADRAAPQGDEADEAR